MSSFLLCAAVLLGGFLLVRPAIAQQALPTAPAQAASDSVLARATQTASGMRYAIRQPGTGAVAQPGDRVLVHYTGFLPSGRIFDASVRQGGPLKIRAGRGEVIKGWDEVLLLLPQGARARVWVPAQLAYADKGVRDPDDTNHYLIPPNTDLVFELEIVKVK